MRRTIRLCVAGALASSALVALPAAADNHLDVVLTGVDNGRGLTFAADGTLYVASSGIGDPAYTSEDYDTEAAMCIEGPEGGASCYGNTGTLYEVPDAANMTNEAASGHVLVDELPSHAGLGGAEGIGPADVWLGADGWLYYTVGLGADPAARETLTADGADKADLFATLRRVNPAAPALGEEVADIGDHEATDPDGAGPDSNPFGVVADTANDLAVVLDSGGNTVLEVALPGGAVSTGAVLPPVFVPAPPFLGAPAGTNIPAQAVPTQLSPFAGGGYVLGQLTGFPFAPGSASVWTYDGEVAPWAAGFTNVIDVVQGPDGAVYVLEISHAGLLNEEGLPMGALIRVTMDDGVATRELLADDIPMPGGMAFDPTDEGMLYMTTMSAGPDGNVVRFDTATADPLVSITDDTATTQEDLRLVAGDATDTQHVEVVADVAANDTGVTTVTPIDAQTGAVTEGSLVYQPGVHRSGTDIVTYRGCDEAGNCAIGTLTVTVEETETDRIAGENRMLTAIEASMAHFPDGAPTVLIARADLYPDALAGGPLAAATNGPILLTGGDGLDEDTAAEITRLGATTAYVLGGSAALADEVEDAVRAIVPDTQRVAGENRYATAVEIMERIETVRGEAAVKAFIVEGYDPDPNRGWPDAVAISGTASNTLTPILLVETDRLPDETAAAIADLSTVTVVGGSVAISDATQAAIDDIVDQVHEIAGDTRYHTSQQIAEGFSKRFGGVGNVALVSGGNWPDALVAGPLTGPRIDALLLVHPTDLSQSPETVAFIQDHAPLQDIDLWGGSVAISTTVEAGIAAANAE